MTPKVPPLFALHGIRKSFGSAQVLKGVDLALSQGEVVGFLGANGAGKSTLMKIVAGILRPDAGSMILNDRPHSPSSPTEAQRAGIAIVHQEFSLVNGLSIADNLFLGREKQSLGIVDRHYQRIKAVEILRRLGCELSPDRAVGGLRTGEKQIVEIARALLGSSRVLILDEPTAALSPGESANLFRIVKELAAQGIGIIYISHRLEEIDLLADRAVVLRDGQVVYNEPKGSFSRKGIVAAMAGRELEEDVGQAASGANELGAVLLKAEQVGRKPLIKGVTLELKAGELVALTGLIGSGRTELLRLLAGIDPLDSGVLRLGETRPGIAAEIGFLPEDRKDQGLFLRHKALWNLSVGVLPRLRKGFAQAIAAGKAKRKGFFGLIATDAERELFRTTSQQLNIQPPDAHLASARFSGGNQQKILLGRILAGQPKILLLDEPTRGVDVGARRDIYRILREQARAGAAVCFATSEFEEALALGQRIVVLREGQIAADLPNRAGLSPQDLMHHAVPEGS